MALEIAGSGGVVEERRREQVLLSAKRYKKREEARAQEALPIAEGGGELDTAERVFSRMTMIDPLDGLGRERVLGRSDLLSLNYLEIGLRKAKAIGRIQVRDSSGRVIGFGTGFLVSPSLLLTNNHVLASFEEAVRSLVDFNFEDDFDFRPKPIATYSLEPARFFFTDKALDFTLVAVSSTSIDGRQLDEFGFLELLPESGKALVGESVSIIQHPSGASKQIALRENEVIDLPEAFIQYSTDTMPGSSGSAVFNDQWLVVALHHSSVPKLNAQRKPLAKNGKVWKPEMGEDEMAWIANEGVRVSSIVAAIRSKQDWKQQERALLAEIPSSQIVLEPAAPKSAPTPPRQQSATIEVRELALVSYANRKGYDETFLKVKVPLPTLTSAQLQDCATMGTSSTYVIPYTHFSVVLSKGRKLARYTAVNIDGAKAEDLGPRENDRWYFDPRVPRKFQSGPELYSNNPLDRGHLVRRLDPVWGSSAVAQLANEDTFHFTNCSPQHAKLNQKMWLELEDFILRNAIDYGFRASVFTGPVFRDDDMLYRDSFRIPVEYWKVVSMVQQESGRLSVTAYLRTQKKLIADLEFAYADEYKTYQVPVGRIEALSGLDFGLLRDSDPLFGKEGAVDAREISSASDLRF